MFVLTQVNSIANTFLKELRAVDIQKDGGRFRKNMERLGEVFAYEISKTLHYQEEDVVTPLGTSKIFVPQDKIVLAAVLRAGVPLYQGMLNFFDNAESAFVAAYRGPQQQDYSYDIKMDYMATPAIDGKVLILIDPMLATGRSILTAYKSFLKLGNPKEVHLVSVIASQQGVEFVCKEMKEVNLWVGAIDQGLNAKSYIVPGLGDAGDLAFGVKM